MGASVGRLPAAFPEEWLVKTAAWAAIPVCSRNLLCSPARVRPEQNISAFPNSSRQRDERGRARLRRRRDRRTTCSAAVVRTSLIRHHRAAPTGDVLLTGAVLAALGRYAKVPESTCVLLMADRGEALEHRHRLAGRAGPVVITAALLGLHSGG